MKSCKFCKTFNPLDETHGQCRKEPPEAALVPVQGIGGQSAAVMSYWPQVKNDDWCGAFEPGFEKGLVSPLASSN